MIELKDFIDELKENKEFADGFDREYEKLKIGYLLKQARKKIGMTQEKMAEKMNTYKGNISRIENHAEDIKLSTLERFAAALDRRLVLSLE
ncbi:MAG: helix-turn-helix transcriptional regulator [Candidatus Aminicenantes bacterium]|nr:helix-turn-helix transcriptional regulator [Candidatus Aminicenantes bacterium]